jgi:hypothetical protein
MQTISTYPPALKMLLICCINQNCLIRRIVDEAIHQISLTTEGLNPETNIFSTKVLTRILSERKPSAMLTLLSKSIFRPTHIPMEIFSVSNKRLFYTNRLQYLAKKYTKYAWQRFFTKQPIIPRNQTSKRIVEMAAFLKTFRKNLMIMRITRL